MTPAERWHDRRRSIRHVDGEHGSAIAEFAMVTALLLVVALGVFQLGFTLYVRNTLISAASEGARYGARVDASPSDGIARTSTLITSSLRRSYAEDVSASPRTTSSSRCHERSVSMSVRR